MNFDLDRKTVAIVVVLIVLVAAVISEYQDNGGNWSGNQNPSGYPGNNPYVTPGSGPYANPAYNNPTYPPGYGPQTPGYGPNGPGYGPSGPGYGPNSPDYGPNGPGYGPNSPGYGPGQPGYGPNGPGYGPPGAPGYGPNTPAYGPDGPGNGPNAPGYGPTGYPAPNYGPGNAQSPGYGPQDGGYPPSGYGPQGPGQSAPTSTDVWIDDRATRAPGAAGEADAESDAPVMARACLGAWLVVLVAAARADVPPPVDLPIQNLRQETQVWCWAAVAQQIIMATRGPQATPPQCALVARAYSQRPETCCGMPWNCTVTGNLQQIQGLIAEFGGRYSQIAAPTDPMTLYSTLSAGRAIILAVKSSPFAGHVIVLRGMAWVPTWNGVQPVLYINDPMAYYTQPVPFEAIARMWDAAIVVQ